MERHQHTARKRIGHGSLLKRCGRKAYKVFGRGIFSAAGKDGIFPLRKAQTDDADAFAAYDAAKKDLRAVQLGVGSDERIVAVGKNNL